ncbi:MAG: spondin domain-containing protein, partial [Chloroflexi bacterium]|nr:spondin domain-containing protein [Chloroflexota bacterium]
DTNGALLDPGASATITVAGQGAGDRITLAAMLIPTNDGFVALVDAAAPRPGRSLVFRAPAYDAGSEQNDELCESIPGPFFEECGGPGGGGSPGNGEGYVHIHAGLHGIGDMTESERDWRNPVAEIVITAKN